MPRRRRVRHRSAHPAYRPGKRDRMLLEVLRYLKDGAKSLEVAHARQLEARGWIWLEIRGRDILWATTRKGKRELDVFTREHNRAS